MSAPAGLLLFLAGARSAQDVPGAEHPGPVPPPRGGLPRAGPGRLAAAVAPGGGGGRRAVSLRPGMAPLVPS